MIKNGTLVAFALAGLFATGACSQTKKDEPSGKGSPTMEANVKCSGVNACAGHGGCKSAMNECKGHNACKGKSFVEMSSDECAKQGGKVM